MDSCFKMLILEVTSSLFLDLRSSMDMKISIMKKVGVIGIGRLGICMALCFERAGYEVYCFDINKTVMKCIDTRRIQSYEPGVSKMLADAVHIHTSTLDEMMNECDMIFVVVPTPTLTNNKYDHQFIEQVVATLKPQTQRKTLVISCTVMPGYCQDLARRVKDIGYDVCYNPEFIAQGDIVNGFENPDIVLIGADSAQVADRLAAVYRDVCNNEPSYRLMSLMEAEITKISLNCFITMKIAFANMVGDLVKHVGCNPQVVLDAISSDSRVGSKCMTYGYGYGGPCFPRDNLALQAFARSKDVRMCLSEATDKANENHMLMMVDAYKSTGNDFVFNCVTYKPESVILEKSFALELAVKLAKDGCNVHIHERQCVIDAVKHMYDDLFTYSTRE